MNTRSESSRPTRRLAENFAEIARRIDASVKSLEQTLAAAEHAESGQSTGQVDGK